MSALYATGTISYFREAQGFLYTSEKKRLIKHHFVQNLAVYSNTDDTNEHFLNKAEEGLG